MAGFGWHRSDPRVNDPVAVILAAGLATRMGRPKQMLPYGDTTVLGAVIEKARRTDLRVIVVLGAYRDEIEMAVDLSGVEVVYNSEPERGNISSLRLAVDQAPNSPVLLLMGDMPGIDAAVIDAHLQRRKQSPGWMAVTEYTDRTGHPFMLSAELIGTLGDVFGRKPLWALTNDSRVDRVVVDGAMPTDVDTPGDYDEALARKQPEPPEL